jgi:ketosteroid isomerase-like protein
MRRRILMLAAVAAAAMAVGCAQKAPQVPAVDLAAEAQAVRDRSAAWLQMAQAKDISGLVNDIYTPNAISMFDGDIRKGSAVIRASEEIRLALPDQTFSWSATNVQVAKSGDLAYELGTFWFDTDGTGEQPVISGEYVVVWTKAEGTWRVAVESSTAVKSPEAPAQ